MKKINNVGETAWCTCHKDFSHINNFSKNLSRHNGLDNVCKICKSKKNENVVYRANRAWVEIQKRCLNKDKRQN